MNIRLFWNDLPIVWEFTLDQPHDKSHITFANEAAIAIKTQLELIRIFLVQKSLELCQAFSRNNDTRIQTIEISTQSTIYDCQSVTIGRNHPCLARVCQLFKVHPIEVVTRFIYGRGVHCLFDHLLK